MSLTTIEVPTIEAIGPTVPQVHPAALFAPTRQTAVVRCGLGVAAAAAALLLPWVGLNLSPDLSAWNLTFALSRVPLVDHLSYGAVIAVLMAAVLVSLFRSRGLPTAVTRSIGWILVALSIVFVVSTRVTGVATMFALTNDTTQTQIINSQFLTNNNNPPPTEFFGISFDAKTLILLYALRAGWYLLLASGLLLAGRVPFPRERRQWVLATVAGVGVLAVAAGLAFGSLAQSAMDNGIQSVNTGQPAQGQASLDAALRDNPQMAYAPELEQALGQAEADQGRTSGLVDYAEATRPVGVNLGLLQQAQLFSDALDALPAHSPQAAVVAAGAAAFLANATVDVRNPDVLTLVTGILSTPSVTFTVGRYDYEAGAEPSAIRLLERTVASTSNSEVRSIALTYIALAWQRIGDEAQFRSAIVAAVRADTLNENVYAREISTGLYVPGDP